MSFFSRYVLPAIVSVGVPVAASYGQDKNEEAGNVVSVGVTLRNPAELALEDPVWLGRLAEAVEEYRKAGGEASGFETEYQILKYFSKEMRLETGINNFETYVMSDETPGDKKEFFLGCLGIKPAYILDADDLDSLSATSKK